MVHSLDADDLPEFDQPGGEGGEHLDDFRAPEIDGEAARPDDVIRADLEPEAGEVLDAEPMGKDAFWQVFQAAFSVPMMLGADFAPLAIQPDEKPAARVASDACHDLLAIYYPKALMPQGETFGLILAAGPFLLAKAMLVRSILAERKAKRLAEAEAARRAFYGKAQAVPDQGQPVAANANRPPPPAPASPLSWMDQEQAA